MARAQALTLRIQVKANQLTLTLTGDGATVYTIQSTTSLSATNLWVGRALLQAQAGGSVWSDVSPPSSGQRFYRAVSFVPAETNLVFVPPGTFTCGRKPRGRAISRPAQSSLTLRHTPLCEPV